MSHVRNKKKQYPNILLNYVYIHKPNDTKTMLFQKYDADSNGEITLDEYYNFIHKAVPSLEHTVNYLFKTFDVDENGRITMVDFKAMMKTMGTDKNGHVSQKDFEA